MIAKGGDGLPVTWWDHTASWLVTPITPGSITLGVAVLLAVVALLWLLALLAWRPNHHPMRRTAPKPDRYTAFERETMQQGGWR